MIAIIDYGVGNLFSLSSSLKCIGEEALITGDEAEIRAADKIILPGVGAFGDAVNKLVERGLDRTVVREAEAGKPLLGICLGMQLLFERSFEYGEHRGLGLLEGDVISMQSKLPPQLRIPHIGWNSLEIKRESPILKYIKNGDFVYFVHSYYVDGGNKNTVAVAEYGESITGTVQKGNVFGCQFHPEKSGEVGLSILRAFCEVTR